MSWVFAGHACLRVGLFLDWSLVCSVTFVRVRHLSLSEDIRRLLFNFLNASDDKLSPELADKKQWKTSSLTVAWFDILE